jgi:hypothetical protein
MYCRDQTPAGGSISFGVQIDRDIERASRMKKITSSTLCLDSNSPPER